MAPQITLCKNNNLQGYDDLNRWAFVIDGALELVRAQVKIISEQLCLHF